MKIAVSADGNELDSPIDPRFGRCASFIIVDTDTMRFEVLENEDATLEGGAGIRAATIIASHGATALITGRLGQYAVGTLFAAGLQTFTTQTGTVREAIEVYKNGRAKPSGAATVSDYDGAGKNFW